MSSPSAQLDPRIVERARRGDAAAFERIVAHYQDRIFGLAYRLTWNRELAADIAQDVFLRLFERLDRYEPSKGSFEPWFLTLAHNYALNARAKAKLRQAPSIDAPIPGEDAAREPADPSARSAGAEAAEADERRLVREAIRELPEKYAGVVVLHYFEGLGVKEISERTGMPEGTVKIRLYRGRNVLREKLERFRKG